MKHGRTAALTLITLLAGANLAVSACCVVAPAQLSNTIGFASKTTWHGKRIHILGYQNCAKNISDQANAMLLPIPCLPGSMSQANIVDVSAAPHFMEQMDQAVKFPLLDPVTLYIVIPSAAVVFLLALWLGFSKRFCCLTALLLSVVTLVVGVFVFSLGGISKPYGALVFNHDIYTIVLANDGSQLSAALNRVQPDRRPRINHRIFEAYTRWYKGWTFALCCFNNKEALGSKPLVWWYEPAYRHLLFFPALDAHDGRVPDLAAEVQVDHSVSIATDVPHYSGPWIQLNYTKGATRKDIPTNEKRSPALFDLLPDSIMGKEFNGGMQQGDFVFLIDDLRNGKYQPIRTLPPGAGGTSDIWSPSSIDGVST